MSSVPIAHGGDLLISLPIFMGPVLAVLAWIAIARYRDRRG